MNKEAKRIQSWFDTMESLHIEATPAEKAKRALERQWTQQTCDSLEAEGWYDNYTLAERGASGGFHKRYLEIKRAYEDEQCLAALGEREREFDAESDGH
tara:strand:+ start:127 stop:423 length:297 start_codon:yes stop_codon:yes gene_type:complete